VKIISLKKLGINRLSIGVQSFADNELLMLGRLHSAQEAMETVDWAKKSGFDNINVDLMSGLPNQRLEVWKWNLQTAIDLDPQHLSLYQLSIEPGTEMHNRISKGTLSPPSEEVVLDMDDFTDIVCSKRDFFQYEISNYSKPGFQCKHNINYWKNGEYYAVGAGAVRYLEGERIKNISDPEKYCALLEGGKSVLAEKEILDKEASFRETVIMGLRLVEGVSCEELFERYGIDLIKYYGKVLENLLESSLLEISESSLRLTKQGRAVANTVMSSLV
jgi:oxygen-independent coproporphyrinogen III oxidase